MSLEKLKKTAMSLRDIRVTCRVKVKIDGEEKIAKIKFSHLRPDGLNEIPLEDVIFLEPLGWFKISGVELIEILPWE